VAVEELVPVFDDEAMRPGALDQPKVESGTVVL
jgi:hypothetical protein